MPTRRARSADPPTADPADPGHVADRLHSAAIHLLRRLRQLDVESGLTGPRASALSVLVFGGPRTLGELADAEQVRPPTMTRLVRALERERLVAREGDPADARRVRVRATPKGESILVAGRKRRVAALERVLRRRSAGEVAELSQATTLIQDVIRELSEELGRG
jgi:DNA-binding MarR family transcriptional regulator